MITKSTLDLRISMLLCKNGYNNWISIFICSIISILCGLIIIVNPNMGGVALITSIGVIIVLYSISNIIDTIVFKKDIKDITKLLNM